MFLMTMMTCFSKFSFNEAILYLDFSKRVSQPSGLDCPEIGLAS